MILVNPYPGWTARELVYRARHVMRFARRQKYQQDDPAEYMRDAWREVEALMRIAFVLNGNIEAELVAGDDEDEPEYEMEGE